MCDGQCNFVAGIRVSMGVLLSPCTSVSISISSANVCQTYEHWVSGYCLCCVGCVRLDMCCFLVSIDCVLCVLGVCMWCVYLGLCMFAYAAGMRVGYACCFLHVWCASWPCVSGMCVYVLVRACVYTYPAAWKALFRSMATSVLYRHSLWLTGNQCTLGILAPVTLGLCIDYDQVATRLDQRSRSSFNG